MLTENLFVAVKCLTSLLNLCKFDVCVCVCSGKNCFNSVNVGFLIDGSSSVGESNFQQVLNFLAAIASSFDISEVGSRFGQICD